jgi:hypothetical protein
MQFSCSSMRLSLSSRLTGLLRAPPMALALQASERRAPALAIVSGAEARVSAAPPGGLYKRSSRSSRIQRRKISALAPWLPL